MFSWRGWHTDLVVHHPLWILCYICLTWVTCHLLILKNHSFYSQSRDLLNFIYIYICNYCGAKNLRVRVHTDLAHIAHLRVACYFIHLWHRDRRCQCRSLGNIIQTNNVLQRWNIKIRMCACILIVCFLLASVLQKHYGVHSIHGRNKESWVQMPWPLFWSASGPNLGACSRSLLISSRRVGN